jgi:hypothetical protein
MHSSIGFLGDTSQAVQDQSRLRQGAVHTALAEAQWLALARGSAKWRAFFGWYNALFTAVGWTLSRMW